MISELGNHLWQSTLFVGVVAVFTLMLRRNSAAVRYRLWLAASVKFVLPFSLLTAMGSQVTWRSAAARAEQPRANVVQQIRSPMAALASPASLLPARAPSRLSGILLSVWLWGFAANSLAWYRRWRRVRIVLRESQRLRVNLSIRAMTTAARLEPGVFGVLRPVLVLPEGLADRLTATQFDAIVEHELCHVRRRDNSWLAIHMLVEALFWFHPAVWWIERRLLEERELACDEEVLRVGRDPRDYAEAILAVCEFYLKAPLVCVSGVTGSNLRRRVERIMLNRAAQRMNFGSKAALALGAALALAGPLAIGLMNAPVSRAQAPAKAVKQAVETSLLPAFEVASIKPSAADSSLKVNFAPGGKLYITNATLRFLIKIAYDIGDDQLTGGPGWVGSKRYDLAATPDRPLGGDPNNMAPDQLLLFHKPVRLRLQRLLAERFQLRLRRESIPMPVFALIVAKGGPKKLAPTTSAGDPQFDAQSGGGVLNARAMDMTSLAKFLSEGQVGRPVVDMTGIRGKYDFHLEWAPETNPNPVQAATVASPPPADTGGISIFTALQQQLGLKLEARTDAADRLVIARAEPPSAN
jgi:bla regulator protein BlaR1